MADAHHTLRLLFPHLDRLAVEGNGGVAASSAAAGSTDRKLLCVEADAEPVSADRRAALLERLAADDVTEVYWRTRDADEARQVAAALERAGYPDVERFGIDPDYYYSLVPLGAGTAPVQRFVLGLKQQRGGMKDRLKHGAKRALVLAGRSERLYEGFVVVGVRRPYSGDELERLGS